MGLQRRLGAVQPALGRADPGLQGAGVGQHPALFVRLQLDGGKRRDRRLHRGRRAGQVAALLQQLRLDQPIEGGVDAERGKRLGDERAGRPINPEGAFDLPQFDQDPRRLGQRPGDQERLVLRIFQRGDQRQDLVDRTGRRRPVVHGQGDIGGQHLATQIERAVEGVLLLPDVVLENPVGHFRRPEGELAGVQVVGGGADLLAPLDFIGGRRGLGQLQIGAELGDHAAVRGRMDADVQQGLARR